MRGGHNARELALKSVAARKLKAEARKAAADEAAKDPQLEMIAAAVRARIDADPHDVGAHVLGRLLNEAYNSTSATARVAALRELADHFSPRKAAPADDEERGPGPIEYAPGRHLTGIQDVVLLAERLGVNLWSGRHDDGPRGEADAISAMATQLYRRVIEYRESNAWRTLGYESWEACAAAEFGGSPSTPPGGTGRVAAPKSIERRGTPSTADNSPSESAVEQVGGAAKTGTSVPETEGEVAGLARFKRGLWGLFS